MGVASRKQEGRLKTGDDLKHGTEVLSNKNKLHNYFGFAATFRFVLIWSLLAIMCGSSAITLPHDTLIIQFLLHSALYGDELPSMHTNWDK